MDIVNSIPDWVYRVFVFGLIQAALIICWILYIKGLIKQWADAERRAKNQMKSLQSHVKYYYERQPEITIEVKDNVIHLIFDGDYNSGTVFSESPDSLKEILFNRYGIPISTKAE